MTRDIEIWFYLDKCLVETVKNIEDEEIEAPFDFGFIKVSIEFSLKEYETISNAGMLTRPKYLAVLGVLSFISDEPFDVFGPHTRSFVQPNGLEGFNSNSTTKFKVENVDLTYELKEFLSEINGAKGHEQSLIFSLLDRWRKGRYLEKENEQSLLYLDEATLSYFHVLELLGNNYSNEITSKLIEKIETLVDDVNSNLLFLTGDHLEQKNSEKTNLIKSVWTSEISIASKINYLLKKLDLYTKETAFWVKVLIDQRNSVAHGRRVHYDKAIFPVRPFFPLVFDDLYPLEYLRVFVAKVISRYLDIPFYNEEWEELNEWLIVDLNTTKSNINHESFESSENLNDDAKKVLYGGLNYFILTNKIDIKEAHRFYEYYLNNEINNDDFLCSNIEALVILYEYQDDQKLSDKIFSAFRKIEELDCNPYLRFRDLMYYLDYYNFETNNLEKLISTKEIK
ncbi:MAG: hypothetical protein MK198_06790 [Gracilimonas sp.]|uniref:hypothetical protein n=1 Tax=Gracilimonas sp. TaxID=1974203 RepID=UPI0037518184|nr:hypothetical protein [Gracilimonas sp.]